MSGAAKICVMCGTDCAGEARIKDPRGRYYHKSCYEDAKERRGGAFDAAAMAAVGTPDEALGPDDLLEPQRGFDLEAIMGEVQQSRACPQCGAGLEASAVICVQCGCNVRENAPLARPMVQRAPRERGVRMTVWPIVIGVISLLYAAALLLMHAVELADASGEVARGTRRSVLGIGLAIWLMLAAVGILRRRQSGAAWMRRWAMTQIVLAVIAVVAVAVIHNQIAAALNMDIDFLLVAVIVSVVIGVIWPIILMVWLGRSSIRKEIDEWD